MKTVFSILMIIAALMIMFFEYDAPTPEHVAEFIELVNGGK